MNQIKVKAAPGVKVPKEGQARRYITDAEPVTITLTAYYRRQMSAGDLLEQAETAGQVADNEPQAAEQPLVKEQQEQGTGVASGKSKR